PLAYEEFVDFLAGGTTPQGIIDFRPSSLTRARVADLIRRQKLALLSPEETAELSQYLLVEHIMRLARARARQRLAGTAAQRDSEASDFLED
ncbi:MAG TPA: hypothetical protein VFW33_19050, partial [Gemmataceae bacterium]|nr:hypothetical protein [Gemmataceae bacterium]